jgi:hypothetical protein
MHRLLWLLLLLVLALIRPRKQGNRSFVRYFVRRQGVRAELFDAPPSLLQPPPPGLTAAEAVVALCFHVSSDATPSETLLSREPPDPGWQRRFDEAFFVKIEEVARDFRVLGFGWLAWPMLKYGALLAESLGLRGEAARLRERLQHQIRGHLDQFRLSG